MASPALFLGFLAASLVLPAIFFPRVVRVLGSVIGWYIRKRTQPRREILLARVAIEEEEYEQSKQDVSRPPPSDDDDWEKIDSHAAATAANGGKAAKDWKGIVGFFHPFCNAGGGGERVLWAAIRATQARWPGAVCVVYTGDHDVDKDMILRRVSDRFNIHLHPPTIHFSYLSLRRFVLSSTWPYFTLLGQSIGSIILAYDAFTLMVPDIFVDTMGYAFALGLSKFLFADVPTGAYVHYPTISTDMLQSLSASTDSGKGLNAGSGSGLKGALKSRYWHLFAALYSWVGGSVDVVMTNSTWTQRHVHQLWSKSRTHRGRENEITVVFPPVAVEELEEQIEVSAQSESKRGPYLLYIAQFRPEKNHTLILNAFAELISSPPYDAKSEHTDTSQIPKLILIGSVRDSDDARRVYNLRLLAHELQIKDHVDFVCDASWPQILSWLTKASVGVNSMWNEHFGIGVVEYQAAGLISVVNNSGGPKLDIVVDNGDGPTGFHASTAAEYASSFLAALSLSPQEKVAMRQNARKSAKRFTEEAFAKKWVEQMEALVEKVPPEKLEAVFKEQEEGKKILQAR